MDELEQLRQRKAAQMSEEQKVVEQIRELEGFVKQIMTKEALQRYGTVKLAHPENAITALTLLAQAIQAGKLRSIDDETLKAVLKTLGKRRDIKIRRI